MTIYHLGKPTIISGTQQFEFANPFWWWYKSEEISPSDITGVCVGIYYEGIYMVKVILAEKRHFECPNEKVEENGLVTKSSILSKESLGWPNTQIQIHKYTNMCI